MRTLRLALFSLAACLSFMAHAACIYYTTDYTGATRFGSASAACTAAVSEMYGGAPGIWGVVDDSTFTTYCVLWSQSGSDPAVKGSMFVISKHTDPDCNQCASNAGKTSVLNFTAGWARSATPNSGDYVGELSFPAPGATFCEGGCTVETVGVDDCYRSDVPAPTGLHRISCDYNMVGKGSQCTASAADAAHDKTQPPLPCPGFVGEVNGETKCVGTASKPIPPPSGPGVTQATGASEDKGNPTAGTKPSSGEGSGTGGAGRTPSTGSGTAAGGPAGAAGTKPDGTTPKPDEGKEQAACGAPGQPKCSINEAGTPDGKSAFDSANTGLDQNKDGWLAEIAKVKDLAAPGWTWTFQLPSGCTALSVPAFNLTLDVCQFQPIIHDIMSMLWAIATVMGCALMVFNATGKN